MHGPSPMQATKLSHFAATFTHAFTCTQAYNLTRCAIYGTHMEILLSQDHGQNKQ